MPTALPPPDVAGLADRWTLQPVALAVIVLLAAGYAYGVHRLDRPWPRARTAVFALGLAAIAWTTMGFFGVYARSLYWVWLSQTLLLWLLVPLLVLWGHPLHLARILSGRVDRVLRSRPLLVLSSPLIAPALVPVLSFAIFFGPVGGWTLSVPAFSWVLQIALLVIGAIMVLPLVGLDGEPTSLAVGLALAIGSFELVIDALPGIVLRLHTHLVSTFFSHVPAYAWIPDAYRDQHLAGNILWTFAELVDVPFLWLVFRQWLRADARDAARVDAVLEAERAARRALVTADGAGAADTLPPAEPGQPGDDRDAPWWLSDPRMQDRMRRNR